MQTYYYIYGSEEPISFATEASFQSAPTPNATNSDVKLLVSIFQPLINFWILGPSCLSYGRSIILV